jgi:hypothetical protein
VEAELAKISREVRFRSGANFLAEIETQVRHTDQHQRRQVDRSENQTESPEIFPAHMAAAVVDQTFNYLLAVET